VRRFRLHLTASGAGTLKISVPPSRRCGFKCKAALSVGCGALLCVFEAVSLKDRDIVEILAAGQIGPVAIFEVRQQILLQFYYSDA
jgi:hypothetical protein